MGYLDFCEAPEHNNSVRKIGSEIAKTPKGGPLGVFAISDPIWRREFLCSVASLKSNNDTISTQSRSWPIFNISEAT